MCDQRAAARGGCCDALPHVPTSAGEEEPLPLAYAPSPSSALPGGL
eukprot:CAMPEP_0185448222 /NCGR_PEP_ID=MMETSP1365-20130426/58249_1 /TAXON_ID=38817 /ORGANISM="Gephyrocapsa oceanica, Strain RCC1303" /LENGTH=45 /DNA_ID= /DNA_START= /DNA_END= /DNA_ORIENTATION=